MSVGVVPEPASACPGLTMPELPYLAFHWTLGLPFRAVKSVHPSARHDVHAAPIDRERVLDVLAEADRADPARLRVEDGDLAVCLGHEPDAALEVGERRADPLVRGQHARQVVVADLADAAAVRGHLQPEQVARLGGAPHAAPAVQEEVPPAGEVLLRLGAG